MENETLDNKGNSTIVEALHNGMERCKKVCEAPLKKRQEILEEYANGWYSDETRIRRPINMVARTFNLLVPLLASQNPRSMSRARVAQLRPAAETLRLTLNHLIEKIELGDTVRDGVINALAYMGIFKTGICPGGASIEDGEGRTHSAGQIFCDSVAPEDYFFDTTARKRSEFDFEGNWFYAPFSYIADSGLYDNYDKLGSAYTTWDKLSAKKIVEGGRNYRLDTIRPYVKLAEVWIPSENIIVTIPERGMGDKPLRVVEYNGPKSGPYDTLSLSPFTDSIIPIAPLYINLDLHYLINIMARKMARQANREKKILAYQGNAAGDAERIVQTPDGTTVKVDDINAIKEVEYGGTSDASYAWVNWCVAQWSEMGNNMRLLEGSKAPSPTLGQDQMLQANAGVKIDDMIDAVHSVLRRILNKMSYYIFTDPLLDVSVSKRMIGIGDVPVRLTADTREGDFWSYNFDVEPYSMVRMNPTTRMNKLMQLATGVIIPMLQYSLSQGVVFDVAKFVKSIALDMNLTDGEIDGFYKTIYAESSLGPYQPLRGEIGVGDQLGASGGSRANNSIQYQNRTGGSEPSFPNKPNTNVQ